MIGQSVDGLVDDDSSGGERSPEQSICSAPTVSEE